MISKDAFDHSFFLRLLFFLWTIKIASMQGSTSNQPEVPAVITQAQLTGGNGGDGFGGVGGGGGDGGNDEGEEIEITATVLLGVEDLTNVPDWEIYDLLKHEAGTYTPLNFHYYNMEHYYPPDKRFSVIVDRCYDDFFKCISSQVHSKYVCTLNDLEEYPEGKTYYNTYCEVYLDNCLRGMRYWFILDYGVCRQYKKKEEFFFIEPTRRQMLSSLWKQITGRALYFIQSAKHLAVGDK